MNPYKNSQKGLKGKGGHSLMLNQNLFKCFSSLASFKTKVVECINLLLQATLKIWQSLVKEKSHALLN